MTVTSPQTPVQHPQPDRWRPGGLELLLALIVASIVLAQPIASAAATHPALQTGSTIFVSIVIQALPFLALGVVLSAAITAFVPAEALRRMLPKNQALAVPAACASGVVLPGCECASVPVSGGLMARGVPPSAALTFLLAAPAINPIVIAATFVAFPGRPEVAAARFVASALAAMIMGWLWLRLGRSEWLRVPDRSHLITESKWRTFALSAAHDFLHAGGFLVVGALAAAALNVAVPKTVLNYLGSNVLVAIITMAVLAVVLCVCSEADAFVAASLTQFPVVAQLVFMVVGPMVDLKLVALQAGTFGREFVTRFAPATLFVATASACLVAWVML